MSGFFQGFWAPLRALRVILVSPRILSLVLVPLAINIGLYVAFFHYGFHFVNPKIQSATNHLLAASPTWVARWGLLTALQWGLRVFAWLLLGLIAALTFTITSGIVCAPFNDHLCRATLRDANRKHSDCSPEPEETDRRMGATVRLEIKRMAVLLAGGILAMLLGLIPLLQIPALMLGAWLVAFEYFGYPISQRSGSLFSVLVFTARHPMVSLGFGAFLLLLMALPFASVVYIPLAVVAGSTLYAQASRR